MFKIPQQDYTAKFKHGAVARVNGGQAVGAMTKDLVLVERTLRH